MKATTIKARWAGKLMRSKNFVVVTDTETVIFAEHTDPKKFNDYMSAQMQLGALRKFQVALNRVVREFEKDVMKKFDAPKKKTGRKIAVKVSK